MTESPGLAGELRTPRAAAVAGIIFAAILATVIILVHSATPRASGDPTVWLTSASRRRAVSVSLTLIPFAGIAFLWFIGVIRTHLGAREDKLFATVFLGSGLLFIAMLFGAAASTASLLALFDSASGASNDTLRLGGTLSTMLLGTFATRMAAVFTLSVSNLGRRTSLVPGWLSVFGYVVTVVLLFSPPGLEWVQLLFPGWVLLLSVHILVVSGRSLPVPDQAVAG